MDLKQLHIAQAPFITKLIIFVLFSLQVTIGVYCDVNILGRPSSEFPN